MREKKSGHYLQKYLQLSDSIYSWFVSPAAASLKLWEHWVLEHYLKSVYGKIGCSVGFSESQSFNFSRNIKFISLGTLSSSCSGICSEVYHWPIQTRSMDVVLLHHVLEWSGYPQRILREASRVLVPGGSLLVMSFNPYSLSSMVRFCPAVYPATMKKGWFYSPGKIKKWLNTLGFACDITRFDLRLAPFYYPESKKMPLSPGVINARFPFGSIFTLMAIKESPGFIFQPGKHDRKPELCAASYARTAMEKNQSIL